LRETSANPNPIRETWAPLDTIVTPCCTCLLCFASPLPAALRRLRLFTATEPQGHYRGTALALACSLVTSAALFFPPTVVGCRVLWCLAACLSLRAVGRETAPTCTHSHLGAGRDSLGRLGTRMSLRTLTELYVGACCVAVGCAVEIHRGSCLGCVLSANALAAAIMPRRLVCMTPHDVPCLRLS
jgi:hypothetical protein